MKLFVLPDESASLQGRGDRGGWGWIATVRQNRPRTQQLGDRLPPPRVGPPAIKPTRLPNTPYR